MIKHVEYIFPMILITCSALAAIVYLIKGDYARLVYWIAGATITATVTFGMKG